VLSKTATTDDREYQCFATSHEKDSRFSSKTVGHSEHSIMKRALEGVNSKRSYLLSSCRLWTVDEFYSDLASWTYKSVESGRLSQLPATAVAGYLPGRKTRYRKRNYSASGGGGPSVSVVPRARVSPSVWTVRARRYAVYYSLVFEYRREISLNPTDRVGVKMNVKIYRMNEKKILANDPWNSTVADFPTGRHLFYY